MQEYDPMLEPDPEQWEALDDDERISMVMEYHQKAGIELPDEYTHALLHVVVENQKALGEETPVDAVLHRLIDENLDRHDVVHEIASIRRPLLPHVPCRKVREMQDKQRQQ